MPRYVRAQDVRADVRVVVRRERVADVVQQARDDDLLALAGVLGPGRGLQTVRVAIDLPARERVVATP